MARPKAKAPARRYHISGQSIVTLDGRDIYLGKHDSPECIARYAVLIGIYQSGGLKLPEDFDPAELDHKAATLLGVADTPAQQADQPVQVQHVTALFREHIKLKYATVPQEMRRHERLCSQLEEQFGEVLAQDFGPVRLKSFREFLIREGNSGKKPLARKYINRLVRCVVGIFRHAVAGELIGIDLVHRLETLEALRNGQTSAPEVPAVEPANIEDVRKTAEHLSPIIKAMLRIQIATGARPSEICIMRPCDIDRTGDIWIYHPSRHKTSFRGKAKAIPLVNDAREAVTEFLQRAPDAFCFSPKEAMAWRHAVAAANRVTPDSCGNRVGSNRKETPKSVPRDRYDTSSYRQAIQRAARRASVRQWHPYQLRHLTATVVRAALGIEEARALLGHSTALMTAHYARESIEAATRAAAAAPKL
ncbi:tyrosine-type recombinase/integrase [Aureliella helgolandensis]|uniref:Site-specific tyrosine recombinase XerC n=1 Tax=Aureliella helgolandensis TaxID=2527968 RepID=A0A518G3C4_9BACT|nr:tyrosine-type recombinase/integrase [Aureliella helgolandensis]QDV23039.1 site-specific tyrosine recombinase XerC [Aureliella helgolandensis]